MTTKPMTSDSLRALFLNFFRSKKHAVIPSASLIPENDPTVLFTTAGMHPLVPFLLGEEHPGGRRLASSQKCIRTGDIDEVGDNRHLTFFEMLGNWSLGDYFKAEAIAWSFEFLTSKEQLGIDPSRLYVSVFEGDGDAPRDDETISEWKKQFALASIEAEVGDWKRGIQGNDKIFLYGKGKNWWGPAGETGPCGPDTEMFFDGIGLADASAHAEGWNGDDPCHPNCDCGRYIEIWNDVFMEYFKTKEGIFEKLKQKNVDTGMGLERTVAILNGIEVYKTDVFASLIAIIERLSGKRYGDVEAESRAMRIVADHIRAATFILGDPRGVAPSNTEQGYVVRRLIRRAVRYGKLIGISEMMTQTIAEAVIRQYGAEYPELKLNGGKILEALGSEEKKFATALEKGLREFSKLERIDGKIAFDLYQSFGFPLELTEELSRERGFSVDAKIFAEEFKKHQELSRTASAGTFKGGLADHSEEIVRLHTATHLLHRALREVLGEHVEQRGSNITKDRLRFDFTHAQKLTPEEIHKVEERVNAAIEKNLPVHFEMLEVDEAKQRGAIGLFDDKYAKLGGKVKVYFIGDYSKEICGGPHVEATGSIGRFTIQKEEAVAAGIRRIRATIAGS